MKSLSCHTAALVFLALFGGVAASRATVYTLDNTLGSGNSVTMNGSGANAVTGGPWIVQEYATGAGSGVYTRMFAVQTPGSTTSAQGYNDNVQSQFDQKNGVGIPATQVGVLPIATIGGTQYLQFLIDFGSVKAGSTATIARLQLYSNSDPNIDVSTTGALGSLGSMIFDSGTGNSLVINNITKGSGNGNDAIYIPYADFPTDHNQYVYLYISFTNVTGGGYEEIAYYKGATQTAGFTPEAHTVWGGVSLGMLLIGGHLRNRFKKVA